MYTRYQTPDAMRFVCIGHEDQSDSWIAEYAMLLEESTVRDVERASNMSSQFQGSAIHGWLRGQEPRNRWSVRQGPKDRADSRTGNTVSEFVSVFGPGNDPVYGLWTGQ